MKPSLSPAGVTRNPLRRALSPLILLLTVVLLGAVAGTGFYIHDTMSTVRQGLPAEILRQSGDLARLVQTLGDMAHDAELARVQPGAVRRQALLDHVGDLEHRLANLRDSYTFDNEIGAAAVHAVAGPAAADIRRWLGQGASGLAPDSPEVLQLVATRAVQAYQRVRELAAGANDTAHKLLSQEAARLDRFQASVLLMIVLLVGLTLLLVGVMLAGRMAEARVRELRDQLAEAIESVPEGFVLCDADDRLVVCNSQYLRMYPGIRQVAVPGTPFVDIVRTFMVKHPLIDGHACLEDALARRMERHFNPGKAVEHELADGRRFRVTERRTRQGGIVGIHSDISDVRRAHERLSHLANHDPLTGLPNRAYAQERLGQALSRASRRDGRFAVMYLDLDRFKLVNDTLGHHVGDELLQAVSKRLRRNLRDADTLARLGGDEFMIVLEDTESDGEAAMATARRLSQAMSRAFQVAGHELFVTTSIGIARYPEHGDSSALLMQNADAASYHAKAQGPNNYCVYTAELNAAAHQRIQRETDLRHALERDELVLYYQPRFALDEQRLLGLEALLRWRHPREGLLAPSDFLPLAEETGLIVPIGEWVLRRACRDYGHWHRRGVAPPRLAVNLSARQFRQPTLLETLRQLMAQGLLPPDCLELEITEAALMDDLDEATSLMNALRAQGICLSVDDFGTGYSSLSVLRRLPLDALKIDRIFIQDIHQDEDAVAIVGAIIAMSVKLELRAVAEGVENARQQALLRELGCSEAQGYYYCQPLDFEAMNDYLGRCAEGQGAGAGEPVAGGG